MIKLTWIPTELHTHTIHSDGAFTPAELVEALINRGIKAAALTDHNTPYGSNAFAEEARKAGIIPIPGMEMTTFYGHVISLGTAQPIEWRDVDRDNGITLMTDRVRKAGGVSGLAHPFAPGGILCTGCHMDYTIPMLYPADYLEVWNGDDAHDSIFNRRAYKWWLDLLDSGYRVPASAGTDWHRPSDNASWCCTYLGVPADEPVTTAALLKAITSGNTIVSRGPIPVVTIDNHAGEVCVTVLEGLIGNAAMELRLLGPHGTLLAKAVAAPGFTQSFPLLNTPRVHAELWDATSNGLIAFTTPQYID